MSDTHPFEDSILIAADQTLDPKELPAHGGVYLLSDSDDRPILLGYCESLRRVVPPRLQSEADVAESKRVRLGDIVRSIRWVRTCGAFEGMLVHWQMARRLWPRDYRERIAFGSCWFVRVDPDAAFPRFEPTQVVRAAAGRHFGPIPTRKDAELQARWLEDAFDLCRYYDVLLKTPHGERCVYYEMGRCPAPCDGTVPMEIYHSSVAEAMAFVRRPNDAALAPVRRRMQTAVDALAYERAGAYKKVIEEASRWTDRPMHRRVCDVRTTDWLIIVRAEPRRRGAEKTHIKAFVLSDGAFKSLAAGRSAELTVLLPQWRNDARAFSAESRSSASDDVLVTESLRLVSHFLFRKDQRDALIYPLDALPDDAHIERSLFLIVEAATKRD